MLDRIYIEISNICNVQCSFCPVVERDNSIMSLEQFEKTVVQTIGKAKEVCLHLMGEPLAHPKFPEILKVCEKHSVLIQLTTNGLLIKRYAQIIQNSPIVRQINFSLQSFTDNFPNKRIDGYLGEILKFIKEAHSIRPMMYSNLRLWNEGDEKSEQGNILIYDFIDKYFEVKINRRVEVGNIKSKRIWNRLYLHFDSRFEWPDLNSPFISNEGRCNGVIRHLGIQSEGTVVPCCLDKEAKINLGNIFNNSLSDIMNSDRFVKMKKGFENNQLVEDMCQRCTYIRRFSK